MTGALVLILRILLTLALYSFLCLILWMIWQDIKRAGYQSIQPKIPTLQIQVKTQGADAFLRAFTQPEVTLGRDPMCQLSIDDEAISARHAKFSFHHGQWWVEDLKSKNGTKLNADRLKTPTVLTNGDQLRCGQSVLDIGLESGFERRGEAAVEEQHD